VTVQPRPRGFTLIELMVALAILALLLLLGMPSFTTFLRNSEVRSTSESIINGLRAATTKAANLNQTVTFSLKGGEGASWTGWEITYVDDDGVTQPIENYTKKEAGANSQIKVTPPGKLLVRFNGLGRVVNQGGADHIQSICIFIGSVGDPCVAVDEYHPLQIIVDDPNPDPTKRQGLRMCDPAFAAATDPRGC